MNRIGIIGCGYWGPNHIRVFSQLKGCTIVGIADQSEERLRTVGQMFPSIPRFSSHQALLRESGADAVVIVTPTRSHASVVGDALNAGAHVLCEKPLCIEPTDAESLTRTAQARGLVLMVGHIFLFNPGLRKVKELIDAGEAGAIRSLSATRTNLGPVRSDVNSSWDLASHDVAVFNWLLGSTPVEVQAMGAAILQPGVEDVVNISLRYPDNVLASIHCSWLDPKKVRRATFVGSKRMITWDDLELSNPVAIYEKSVEAHREMSTYGEFLRFSMLDGDVRLPKVNAAEPLKAQNEAFLTAIRDRPATHLSDATFATGVVRVLHQIEECLKRSRNTLASP
jgi:predicted dehydrogenase